MRLLFISVGTLFVFGVLLLMTRFWGLSQGYQAFAHPFLEPAKPWYAVQVFDLKEATSLVQKLIVLGFCQIQPKNNVILFLD